MAKTAPRAMDNIFANMATEAKKINEKEAEETAVIISQKTKSAKSKSEAAEKKIESVPLKSEVVESDEKSEEKAVEERSKSKTKEDRNLTKKNHAYTMDEETYQLMSAIISVLRQNGITDESDRRPISESFYIRSAVRRENERIMNLNTEEFKKEVQAAMDHTPEKPKNIIF